MSDQIDVTLLSRYQPLNALNTDNLQEVLKHAKAEEIPAGKFLFRKGDTQNAQIYLLKGEVDLLGDSGVLKTIKAGTSDGVNAIAHILPRTITAKSKTDVAVFKVDGDLIDVMLTWDQTGDAPEVSHSKNQPGQPFSKAATKYLAAMVLNKTVAIKSYGSDRYGRTLAEVALDNRIVNIEMIQAGLSEGYRGRPASGLDMAPYRKAEEEARGAKRGMWVLGEKYVSPRDWRRMKDQLTPDSYHTTGFERF